MWSPDVTVISRHEFSELDAERLRLLDIGIVRDEVAALVHEGDRLVAVTTHGGEQMACDAAWITSTQRAASDLAASLCEVDEAGFAKTDKVGATSRPGVWAIGTANEPWAHLAHASAAGTGVGPVVTFYLLEQMLEERRAAELARRAA
jgi:thioredoxin reductase